MIPMDYPDTDKVQEPVLQVWRPKAAVFRRRTALRGGLTLVSLYVMLGFLGINGWGLLASGVLAFVYFGIDDYSIWRRRRADSWTLSPTALVFANADEPAGDERIMLADIAKMRNIPGWGLNLHLHNGQVVPMRFLEQPRDIRTTLQGRIDRLNQTGQEPA